MSDKKLLTANTKRGNENNEKKSYLGMTALFILGIVLGAGIVWMTVGQSPEDEQLSYEQEATEQNSDALSSDNNGSGNGVLGEEITQTSQQIVVPDQEAGGTVRIQSVTFDTPGWVVIHELSVENTFGNALGAQRFNAGTHSGDVTLLRVTEAGFQYAAVLYRDNGDRRFDLDLDNPVRDENQEILSTKFVILD